MAFSEAGSAGRSSPPAPPPDWRHDVLHYCKPRGVTECKNEPLLSLLPAVLLLSSNWGRLIMVDTSTSKYLGSLGIRTQNNVGSLMMIDIRIF
jgi:hypothetical protein